MPQVLVRRKLLPVLGICVFTGALTLALTLEVTGLPESVRLSVATMAGILCFWSFYTLFIVKEVRLEAGWLVMASLIKTEKAPVEDIMMLSSAFTVPLLGSVVSLRFSKHGDEQAAAEKIKESFEQLRQTINQDDKKADMAGQVKNLLSGMDNFSVSFASKEEYQSLERVVESYLQRNRTKMSEVFARPNS